jgi:phospholipid/cholesterol/gamma-HCH transport system ATP-binding protein
MKRIAQENLERVGLDARILNLYPNELSGGMQKRVALARAIAPRPEIIFSTSRPPASIRSAPMSSTT